MRSPSPPYSGERVAVRGAFWRTHAPHPIPLPRGRGRGDRSELWHRLALMLMTSLTFAAAAPDACAQSGKVTPGQETTRITARVRPDGTIDYVAALNERMSEGVTP